MDSPPNHNPAPADASGAWKLYTRLVLAFFFFWGLGSLISTAFLYIYVARQPGAGDTAAFLFFPVFAVYYVLAFALAFLGIILGLIGFRDRFLLSLSGLSVLKLLLPSSSGVVGWLVVEVTLAIAMVILPVVALVQKRQRSRIQIAAQPR